MRSDLGKSKAYQADSLFSAIALLLVEMTEELPEVVKWGEGDFGWIDRGLEPCRGTSTIVDTAPPL